MKVREIDRDEDLLADVARGDTNALRELYRSFEKPLYSLGLRWMQGDRQLAEELVQEVTLRIWRAAGTYDASRGAARSWIFGIARNVATDLYRKSLRQPVPVEEVEGSGPGHLDDQAAWRTWEVSKILQDLPLEQQKVIELAYVCQFTQSEMARTLGIPLGTVKTRIQLALSKLEPAFLEAGLVEGETR